MNRGNYENTGIYNTVKSCVKKKNSQRIVINQRTGRPIIIPSKAYKQYEKDVEPFIKGKRELISHRVNVEAVFYRKDRRKIDLVNLLQALDDILVYYGVVQDDCSTIISGHDGSYVSYDKDHPRTEIRITPWHGPRMEVK